jgi:molecular chaperone DnaJ
MLPAAKTSWSGPLSSFKTTVRRSGAAGFGGFDFSQGFEEVFSDIFGDFFGTGRGRSRSRSRRGDDLRYDLEVEFEEAARGTEKVIKFQRLATCDACNSEGTIIANLCPKCQGQGRIRRMASLSVCIPPGVDNGLRLKLRNEGEAGFGGGPSGDLYVVVHVKEHPGRESF